jgi:hypothetical protein
MKPKTLRKLVLAAAVVVAALAALGGLLQSGLLADHLPGAGPDRSALVYEHLREKLVKDPEEGLEVLRCKQVRRSVVARVRADYPTFEIVDCTFRHKDGLGNPLTETHNFWILDEKVIHSETMTFNQSRGQDVEPDLEKYLRYVILREKDPAEARRMRDELRGPGGGGRPGGGPGGGGRQ